MLQGQRIRRLGALCPLIRLSPLPLPPGSLPDCDVVAGQGLLGLQLSCFREIDLPKVQRKIYVHSESSFAWGGLKWIHHLV